MEKNVQPMSLLYFFTILTEDSFKFWEVGVEVSKVFVIVIKAREIDTFVLIPVSC